ncbi:MAG: sigma-70 family RNA polymerase sigma factor [Acidobacteria bacterium]|nr:sigma-70 family RNA polymerase sigma factor [Acidobacteriota bacterium]
MNQRALDLFRRKKTFLAGNKSAAHWFTLVCVAEKRSSAVFEQLAMPLFDRMYNFAHWLTQNRDEADDLVQETYVKALKGFASFELGTNFKAWIFRILRNTFLNSRTGLKAAMVPLGTEDDDPTLPTETETPETILIDRSNERVMQHAIEELPVVYREVLLLCEVEEMSYQEIAATLTVPIGTVMSRLSRARKALRVAVEGKMKRSLA